MSSDHPDPGDQFPPHVLREYALLADGERGALIGPRGDVAWMCAPSWASDAAFSSLIGGGGVYAITPIGRYVWGGYYEAGGLVWHSRWITETGIVECREALAFPGDPGKAVLLRRILPVDTDAHVRVLLDVRAGFGHHRLAGLARDEHHVWTGHSGPLQLRWSGAEGVEAGGLGYPSHVLAGELDVPVGTHRDLVLEIAEHSLTAPPPDPTQRWRATEDAWAETVPSLENTIARNDVRHAYAVLRGLTSSGGGMVASASMSLPERAEAGRNYDYRYVWIRDQCFTGQAIGSAGPHPLLDDAVRFVAERVLADGPRLKPAYTTRGEPVPGQRRLHLPGYPGGQDIAGNHVNAQFQLDALGESLLLFSAAAGHDRLDADGWRAAETAADAIAERWHDTEAGIWELEDRNWTESRLICVAGLKAIAASGAPPGRSRDWLGLADTILAETAGTSVHPAGYWQRAPDDERLDAALLLPAIRGALPRSDPRTLATLAAAHDELAEDGYLYRFRQQPGRLGDAEGAFLLCGFTMAMALHQQGRQLEAARWFERNRSACGPPGLFSEEYDVTQRQLRGNLPQAFVHAFLFEAATRLTEPAVGAADQRSWVSP
jgi:hypothetical protein